MIEVRKRNFFALHGVDPPTEHVGAAGCRSWATSVSATEYDSTICALLKCAPTLASQFDHCPYLSSLSSFLFACRGFLSGCWSRSRPAAVSGVHTLAGYGRGKRPPSSDAEVAATDVECDPLTTTTTTMTLPQLNAVVLSLREYRAVLEAHPWRRSRLQSDEKATPSKATMPRSALPSLSCSSCCRYC